MKKTIITILIFIAVVTTLPQNFAKADDENVLIVYNDKQEMEILTELIVACRKTPVAVDVSEYKSEMLDDYDYIILQDNLPLYDALDKDKKAFCVGSDFVSIPNVKTRPITQNTKVQIKIFENADNINAANDMSYIYQHSGEAVGSIVINEVEYPFAVITKWLTYVPYYNKDDLSIMGLGALLNKYFGNDQAGKMYIMIDEIYPFSDLDILIMTVNKLYDNGMPFILSVMPIYDNTDYPAFNRYIQILKYVQSKNGTIIMHEPLEKNIKTNGESIDDKMNRAYAAFEDNGITIFEKNKKPYEMSYDLLSGVLNHDKQFIEFPINTMFRYQLFETEKELDNAIDILNKKWLILSDYKMNFTTEMYDYQPVEVEEAYLYKPKMEQSLGFFFDAGNRVLSIIVAGSVFIIIILMILGYRLYNRKFMKRKEQA